MDAVLCCAEQFAVCTSIDGIQEVTELRCPSVWAYSLQGGFEWQAGQTAGDIAANVLTAWLRYHPHNACLPAETVTSRLNANQWLCPH